MLAWHEVWIDRLRRHTVEIAMIAVVVFVTLRIYRPLVDGADVVAREHAALGVLREIHAAQIASKAGPSQSFSTLAQLVAAAPRGSALARLVEVPADGVDLFRVDGYFVALFLNDPDRNDDRAWTESTKQSPRAGRVGYGCFAWPVVYGPETQWVFYLDHRGRLLGSGNYGGLYDGTRGPFPPTANPLGDYFAAKKEGDDAEWFLFDSLREILVEAR